MRIAIIRLSALGDIIIASSMLAGLKSLGDYHIEWFVDERFEGILESSPCINKIHSLPFKKLLKGVGGILEIRQYCKNCGDYDIVIDMQGLMKSALVGKCLNSNVFVGFSKKSAREKWASYFYTHKVEIPYDENILQRNFKVLFDYFTKDTNSNINRNKILNMKNQSLGINFHLLHDDIIKQFKKDSVNINLQDSDNTTKSYKFLFVLEASIQEKVYPIEKYAILAHSLQTFLQQCEFYLIWHDDEENANKLYNLLRKDSLKVHKLPKLNFNSLKFCITQMDCVFGGDTGVTHLAWAMGVSCITLYGNLDSTNGKNMRNTKLERVLLGNPYVVSKSNKFEIASINPREIFEKFKYEIYENTSHG
ncbi:lipopolysaccharide heptosyltransferase I [Helicobacter didelphidarum]|uniref:Lipopolysaccharide heptosyltransferase 1 n=1 Tax=Helicobacter didelphidarum TaxID=2040648 RepID=A0A3D8IKM6_9HELI|nr:lipopolysaccharide heptosyltransferase I [Helicobacter didelphidarum]RDU65897.1 lipopolysaccharide heptosyltransferase I [Helicobacter didelphidarum]